MPKLYTFPYLLDDSISLNISELIKWQYIKNNSNKTGYLKWTNDLNQTKSQIEINAVINEHFSFVRLNYYLDGEPVRTVVQLVSVPSNLGKGAVWYFVCPVSGVRCRLLHLKDGVFKHRSLIKNAMYTKQAESKTFRNISKPLSDFHKRESIINELNKKHFKTHYAGKPTKRYKKLLLDLSQIATDDLKKSFCIFR